MEGVIDRVVYASRCCGELITCTPFITVHYCSRQDILSYDGMQCRYIYIYILYIYITYRLEVPCTAVDW